MVGLDRIYVTHAGSGGGTMDIQIYGEAKSERDLLLRIFKMKL